MLCALGVLLAACAPIEMEQEHNVPSTPPAGPLAPELTIETWLNTGPLTRADLRDHVVLIDFWTFG
jgi:hypothetical protein